MSDALAMLNCIAEFEECIKELESEARKLSAFHLPGCRKMIYDIGSSPCTCEAAFDEVIEMHVSRRKDLEAENQRLRDAIKNAPCWDHIQRESDQGTCFCCECTGTQEGCDCWKFEALEADK